MLSMYGCFTNLQFGQLPVGLIAQLHCTGIAEVMGSNPLQALIFVSESCVYNCYDQSCLQKYLTLLRHSVTQCKIKAGLSVVVQCAVSQCINLDCNTSQLKYVSRLEDNASRVVGQNSVAPKGEQISLTH